MRTKLRIPFLGRAALLIGAALWIPACTSGSDSSPDGPVNPMAASADSSISGDGNLVVFDSNSANLVLPPAGSINLTGLLVGRQIFMFNRSTGVLTAVAPTLPSPFGGPDLPSSDFDSSFPRISEDGTSVVFQAVPLPGVTAGSTTTSTSTTTGTSSGTTGTSTGSTTGTTSGTTAGTTTGTTPGTSTSTSGTTGSTPTGAPAGTAGTILTVAQMRTNIFITNLATGKTRLVTTAPDGSPANGDSTQASISSDGSRVAFESTATNLVIGTSGVTTGIPQIFVKSMTTGLVTLVSTGPSGQPGNGPSQNPAISEDGTTVAFESVADDLTGGVAGITGLTSATALSNIFISRLVTGRITLVTAPLSGSASDGNSSSASVDSTGQFVVFTSTATNLMTPTGPPITIGPNIFLWNAASGQFTLLTVTAPGLGTAPGMSAGMSQHPVISANALWVAFDSSASTLSTVAVSTSSTNVFVLNLTTGAITLVSHASPFFLTGVSSATTFSTNPAINADGTFVSFQSDNSQFISTLPTQPVNPAASAALNIFVATVQTGAVQLASPQLGSGTSTSTGTTGTMTGTTGTSTGTTGTTGTSTTGTTGTSTTGTTGTSTTGTSNTGTTGATSTATTSVTVTGQPSETATPTTNGSSTGSATNQIGTVQ